MNARIFAYSLLGSLIVVALIGCNSELNNDNRPTLENMSADVQPTPTVTYTERYPLPHPPYDLDGISCYRLRTDEGRKQYPVDALKPGQSTVDDLALILESSALETPERSGFWEYREGNLVLSFQDGVLDNRNDPRDELSEIVLEYGEPEQVIWQIPRRPFHLAAYRTYLLYPRAGALFYTNEQVTEFGFATDFEYSILVHPSRLEELVAEITIDDDYYAFQYFPWPCDGN